MESTIRNFYDAFGKLDAETMISHYHDDVVFTDPAFGELKGVHAKNMWRMLCASQKDKDFKVKASNFQYAEGKGKAHWEAFYTFSATGRKVHNIIEARFEFKDGKIINHTDHFDLYRWSKQALGTKGWLIGWSGFFKKKLNQQTHALLKSFEAKK